MQDTEELKQRLLAMLDATSDEELTNREKAFRIGSDILQLELYVEDEGVSLKSVLSQLLQTRMGLFMDLIKANTFNESLYNAATLSVWLDARGVMAVPIAKGWLNKVRLWWALGKAAYYSGN